MSDDWKVGDIALCVSCGLGDRDEWVSVDNGSGGPGPTIGSYSHVEMVGRPISARPELGVFLGFAEYPKSLYPSVCFRKVRPDIDPASDEETIALIKRAGQPVPV